MTDDPAARDPAAPFPGASAPTPSDPTHEVIRHAATVVVLRPGAFGREVYMVRRSAKSPFMPSTLVFPGGRLDPQDGPVDHDDSWARAALRECEEEAGLRLTDRDLRWFDTWLTPSAESKRRYLTRFFMVEIGAHEGTEARADGVETHEGRWATAAEHLAGWEAEQIDLPPPTVTVLQRLRDAEADGMSTMLDVDPQGAILPKVIAQGSQIVILMPHDPAYASAPGDEAPAPARVHALPARFVREGRRWMPR